MISLPAPHLLTFDEMTTLRVGQVWKTEEGYDVTLKDRYKEGGDKSDVFVGDDGFHYSSDGIARGTVNPCCSKLVELIAQARHESIVYREVVEINGRAVSIATCDYTDKIHELIEQGDLAATDTDIVDYVKNDICELRF